MAQHGRFRSWAAVEQVRTCIAAIYFYFPNFYRLADLIERDSVVIANLETLDNGKPFEDSVFDIQCAVDTFRFEFNPNQFLPLIFIKFCGMISDTTQASLIKSMATRFQQTKTF